MNYTLISKQRARVLIRLSIAELPDIMVRNLMEHAANETPIIGPADIDSYYSLKGAG